MGLSPPTSTEVLAYIANVERNDQMPAIVEPLFQWGANVDVIPVMNFEDLRNGLRNR